MEQEAQKGSKAKYDDRAKMPFLASRSGKPLLEEVLCDSVRRNTYSFTVSDESWEIIRQLDPALRRPPSCKSNQGKSRERMRELLEGAAKRGNSAPLMELFQTGLLEPKLTRTFCFHKNRDMAHYALLEEARGEPLTQEFYGKFGLLQLFPWETKDELVRQNPIKPRKVRAPERKLAPIARENKFIFNMMKNERREKAAWEAWARKHAKAAEKPRPEPARARRQEKPKREMAPAKHAEKPADAKKPEKMDDESPAPTVVRHSMADLEKAAWTPFSVLKPEDYGNAVFSCWSYFSRKLKEVSESANVMVEISAGSSKVTYKTALAKNEKNEYKPPLHRISLDIAKRAGKHTFRNSQEEFVQEQLVELLGDIVFASKS